MVKLGTLDKLHPGIYIADKVISCTSCGFSHLYPLPDPAAVGRYYNGDYFYSGSDPHSPSDWFEKERREYEAGLWDAYFGYLAGLLDVTKPVIDIGCGSGLFLDYLWRHGWPQWTLYGIEPSQVARQASPIAHRLYKDLYEQKAFLGPKGQWLDRSVLGGGNIILSLVLEHIPDPVRFLQEDVLPHLDGRLVVVVPSEFNPLQQLVALRYPDRKHWFVSPVHLNYFTPASLRGLLERCGLRIVHTGATFPTEVWPLIGRNHIGNDEMGRANHLWRLRLEKRWPGVFKVYEWMGRLAGVGREVVMVAEK